MRHLFASAHTVFRLRPEDTQGHPARSYLNLADQLRRWAHGSDTLEQQLRELWRRMAFNALVGNVDDHPRNHGFLRDQAEGTGWRLSPAFDVTPAGSRAHVPIEDGVPLLLATGADNRSMANKARLLASAPHFDVDVAEAEGWLTRTATQVAQRWDAMIREAAAPILGDVAQLSQLIADVRPSFAYAEWLASQA